MKANIALLLGITISLTTLLGCANEAPLTHIPHDTETSSINFTKYSALGFLYTPYTYTKEYESVCLLSISIMPEANLREYSQKELDKATQAIKEKYQSQGGDIRDLKFRDKFWKINVMNINDVLDSLYVKAKYLGADAIVNFQVETLTKSYKTSIDGLDYPVTLEGFKVRGFAIKRLLPN